MTIIQVATSIAAPIEDCFDAFRDIQHHEKSSSSIQENIVVGKKWGMIEVGDQFTVQFRILGFTQKAEVEITAMDAPYYFEDQQKKGMLQSFSHKHYFTEQGGQTVVRDIITYTTSKGPIMKWINANIIEKRLTSLIEERHAYFKNILEK